MIGSMPESAPVRVSVRASSNQGRWTTATASALIVSTTRCAGKSHRAEYAVVAQSARLGGAAGTDSALEAHLLLTLLGVARPLDCEPWRRGLAGQVGLRAIPELDARSCARRHHKLGSVGSMSAWAARVDLQRDVVGRTIGSSRRGHIVGTIEREMGVFWVIT